MKKADGEPVLVAIARLCEQGLPLPDLTHRGQIAVVDGLGHVLFEMGDITTLTHLRSTAKPFQIIPMFEEGFDFLGPEITERDCALFFSSHSGADIHVERVRELLTHFGLHEHELLCGAHYPQDERAKAELIVANKKPSVLHNNCSGKHLAMLLMCQKMGFSKDDYTKATHPLQKRILQRFAQLCQLDEHDIHYGIDGCSLPAYVLPLQKIAQAYAQLGYGQTHSSSLFSHAFRTMWRAATTYPEMVAGHNRFDTELMTACGGQVFCKSGADGVIGVSVLPSQAYPQGLGIAIKITDGDMGQTIRPLIIKTLLEKHSLWPTEPKLARFMPTEVNVRKLVVRQVSKTF